MAEGSGDSIETQDWKVSPKKPELTEKNIPEKPAEDTIEIKTEKTQAFIKILELDDRSKEFMAEPLPNESPGSSNIVLQVRPESYRQNLEYRIRRFRSLFEEMADQLAKHGQKIDLETINPSFRGLLKELKVENGPMVEAIKNKAKTIEDAYLKATATTFNPADYRAPYGVYVRGMDTELIKEINGKIVGYADIYRSFHEILNKVTSYNELSHLIHVYMEEDVGLLMGMDKWDSDSKGIEAYGEETSVARRIFDCLKTGEFSGVMMFSSGKVAHLTVRDYGHALSIRVEDDIEGMSAVSYKIPKCFGKGNVKDLPGFSSYDEKEDTATGTLLVESEKIGFTLAKFIKQVPTDDSPRRY